MTNESHVENTPTPPPGPTTPGSGPVPGSLPWGMQINTFCMLMHLSQLAGYVVPFAGLVLPIVMWATNKDRFPDVNRHGKVILNWIISAVIYFVVCMILTVIIIGPILAVAVGICWVVFIIIGAIKANSGILWPYPLSIKFYK